MTRDAMPNNALRKERELRGWSQGYVAEQIGAPSPNYISRWERGIMTPIPYYREKLCLLFDKNAQELGLIQFQEETVTKEVSSASQPTPFVGEGKSDLPLQEIPFGARKHQQWLFRYGPAILLMLLLFSLVLIIASSPAILQQRVVTPQPWGSATTRTWPQLQFKSQHYVKGPAVVTIQYMLQARGYSIGSTGIDGSYGPDTDNGVRAFQRASHLAENNGIDGLTWEHLIVPSREGNGESHGSALQVLALQVQLNNHIHAALLLDGRFGHATAIAVGRFQQVNHLAVTGIADLDVWCLLLGGHVLKKSPGASVFVSLS